MSEPSVPEVPPPPAEGAVEAAAITPPPPSLTPPAAAAGADTPLGPEAPSPTGETTPSPTGEPLAASTPTRAPAPAPAPAPHSGIPLPAGAGPKPSGIRPPSRIARPCSVAPKPALPPAATPRATNTSVVLTEDTDSFIIGDRVWVGGTKPGKIAYIGATQFAPGEWAGVVLDDPVGKNDGSVAGIRYFQCEARRGVFSRLTRLTRAPLPPAELSALGANGAASACASGASSPVRPRSSLVSPASSVRDLAAAGARKASSTGSGANGSGALKLGDRVIVMSSMGSKAGVLRYMGATDFAPGDWCGVELDDPLGKNDGAVGDRRYFECQPKFGLFAPAHKVSKSPSSRRPSAACALHHPNAAGSGLPVMRRTGSRESLASSIASSAVSSVRGARVRLGVTSLQKTGVRTPTTPAASRASLQVRF